MLRHVYSLVILLLVAVSILPNEASAAQSSNSRENAELIKRVVERIDNKINPQFNLYPAGQAWSESAGRTQGEYYVGGREESLPGPDLVYYTKKGNKIVTKGEPSKTVHYRQVIHVSLTRGESSWIPDFKPRNWPSLGAEQGRWNYKVVTQSSGTEELAEDRRITYLAVDDWKDIRIGSAAGKMHTYHVSGEQIQVTSYYEDRYTRRPYGEIYSVDWKENHAFCIVPVPGGESVVLEIWAQSRDWRKESPSFHLPFITESQVSGVLALMVAAVEQELGIAPAEQAVAEKETAKEDSAVEIPSVKEDALTIIPAIGKIENFDANPKFQENVAVETMAPLTLIHRVRTKRRGVLADASSQLLLRVELSGPGTVTWMPTLDGGLQPLHGTSTHEVDGKYYSFCIYTPPAQFSHSNPEEGVGDERRRIGGSEVRDISITLSFQPKGEEVVIKKQHQFALVRPPVLLVHGTFDNPKNCWQTSALEVPLQADKGEVSMLDYLQARGHRVYLVDFQSSNGAISLDGLQLNEDADKSSFLDNTQVLWANNGIKQAMSDFRSLGIAATRANVIGHSLGGLIPRLWASDFYNNNLYRRADNFYRGDIHRLITIGTPHFGSDLSALQYVMHEILLNPSVPQLVSQAGHNALRFLMSYYGELGPSKAVISQIPESLPLKQIGPSRIPSHAIIGVATVPSLRDFGGRYLTGLTWTWRFFALNPGALKSMLERHGMGEKTEEILYEGKRSLSWLTGKEEVVVGLKDQVYLALRARALLFGDQPNDMVVRAESQAGGLPLQYTTRFNHVLHSFEPRYRDIQRTCASLLAGPQWKFFDQGFPAAGRKMLNVIPKTHTQEESQRQAAISAGGLPPSHAEAISTVAVAREEWILFRPVNPAATTLILRGLATKDMFVKGKSSNWGPQKGYVCRQQRFSKLVDDEAKISKFNALVEECLLDQRATVVPLRIASGGAEYEVRTIIDEPNPRKAVVLLGRSTRGEARWYHWENDLEGFTYGFPLNEWSGKSLSVEMTRPLEVLADRFSGVPVTADYDLLAFGIRGPKAAPGWDEEMGGITEKQKQSIRQMNYAVRLRARFLQGNVSHHGPEVQYSGSDGVDFPITLFSPDGSIFTASKGPKGQKDREIKHWFHVIRQFGFTINPNPVWEWGDYLPDQFPEHGWNPNDQGARLLPVEIDNDSPFDSND